MIPGYLIEAAKGAARDAASMARDAIREARMELHDNPIYWEAYHTAILEGMTPARRRVAWWHRKRQREARASIKAHAALSGACPNLGA